MTAQFALLIKECTPHIAALQAIIQDCHSRDRSDGSAIRDVEACTARLQVAVKRIKCTNRLVGSYRTWGGWLMASTFAIVVLMMAHNLIDTKQYQDNFKTTFFRVASVLLLGVQVVTPLAVATMLNQKLQRAHRHLLRLHDETKVEHMSSGLMRLMMGLNIDCRGITILGVDITMGKLVSVAIGFVVNIIRFSMH